MGGLRRRLTSAEVLIFRKAIASVMAVNGITLDMISMGDPETSTTSGRRLLQVQSYACHAVELHLQPLQQEMRDVHAALS